MNRPVMISGDRISLGVVLESDAGTVFFENNDPELNRFFTRFGRMSSYEDAVQMIKNLFENGETERVFAIVLNDSGEAIGHVGIHEINWESRYGSVGCQLSKEYWNKGHMTEAVGLVVKYSFEMINLRKLFSHVSEPNIASIRVMEKTGFKESGRLTKHTYVPELGYVDEIFFELFNPNPL